jgi:D-3-phosphoglycerate dehydrogenase
MTQPIPLLAAGDLFVRPDLMRAALAAQDDAAAWDVRELATDWPHDPFGKVAEVDEATGDEDAMIAARLFAVSRGGPVNANLEAATEHGITVTYAPGRNATATAEFAIGLILAAARGIGRGHLEVTSGRWDAENFVYESSGLELEGATVGVVGGGAIGSRVARILLGFGAHVLVHDPYAAPEQLPDGVRLVDLDELLAAAQVVTLHARVTPETTGMLDATRIAAMRPGSVLVNCARGALVDHAALAAALRGGHLAAAGLDVYDVEPLPTDHPLRGLPNLVTTPHLAGASRQVAERAAAMVAVEAGRWRRGEPPLNCANPGSNPGVLDR